MNIMLTGSELYDRYRNVSRVLLPPASSDPLLLLHLLNYDWGCIWCKAAQEQTARWKDQIALKYSVLQLEELCCNRQKPVGFK